MVSLKHKFHSGKTDSSDASIVRPSNWNAEHDFLMASNRLLGRSAAGEGPVGEMTLSSHLQLTSGQLDLSDTTKSNLNGKANKDSIVSEQDEITGSLPGANYILIFNQGDNKEGKILLSDLKTKAEIASSKTKVIGGAGLSNGAGQEELTSDVTINMILPDTLTGSTTNTAPEHAGHTHSINTKDVVGTGIALQNEGGLGTYMLARQTSGTAKVFGETISGASLQTSSATTGGGAGTISGSWRCMGRVTGDATANAGSNITLWMRIS